MAHDLVIRGGFIVDGTGAPGRTGDLAVSGGRIAEVGAVSGRGAREVDAGGLVVAPGFIDPHTHYDAQLTWDPSASCTSWHGVTTIVTGNCGFTMAPCRPQDRLTLMKMLEYVEGMSLEAMQKGIQWEFETFREYLDALDRLPLVGQRGAAHRPLRGAPVRHGRRGVGARGDRRGARAHGRRGAARDGRRGHRLLVDHQHEPRRRSRPPRAEPARHGRRARVPGRARWARPAAASSSSPSAAAGPIAWPRSTGTWSWPAPRGDRSRWSRCATTPAGPTSTARSSPASTRPGARGSASIRRARARR